jgi:hypothetical protein
LPALASDFPYLCSGSAELKKILAHAAGIITPAARQFVPQTQRGEMIWSSRVHIEHKPFSCTDFNVTLPGRRGGRQRGAGET